VQQLSGDPARCRNEEPHPRRVVASTRGLAAARGGGREREGRLDADGQLGARPAFSSTGLTAIFTIVFGCVLHPQTTIFVFVNVKISRVFSCIHRQHPLQSSEGCMRLRWDIDWSCQNEKSYRLARGDAECLLEPVPGFPNMSAFMNRETG